MKLGTKISLLLLAFLLGALCTHYLRPAKTIVKEAQIKEKIIYKDKIITKVKVVETKPDGTTIVTEKDQTEEKDKISTLDTKISEKVKILDSRQLTYGVTILAMPDIKNFGSVSYGIQVEYRVLGPFWVNIFALSNISGGVGIGFKF